MRPAARILVVVLVAVAGPATAQPPPAPAGPGLPSAFSPYLNLARGGNPGINYFGIVRPLERQQNAIQSLQEGGLPNPFQPAAPGEERQLVTGNPFGFQNYRLYFQNQMLGGGGGAAGGQSGGPRVGVQAGALPGGQLGVTPQSRRR